MARMSVALNSGGSSVKGVGYLTAAASSMRRAKVQAWEIGCSAAPADNTFVHIAQRCTTASTATGRTPNALDPADTLASTIVAADTVTVDATLTAGAFSVNVPVNARATLRWVSVPFCEIIIPATASNGFMFGLSAATTTTFAYSITFEEM